MAAALAVYPAVQDIRLHWLAVAVGGLALGIMVLALLAGSGPAFGWGLAFLGGEYAVWFSEQGSALDEGTPLYAGGFMLAAELGYWSLERRVEAWSDPDLPVRRLVHLVLSAGGAAAVAALVLVESAAAGGGGAALEAVGVAAAIGAVVLMAMLLRRSVLR